MKKLLYLLLVLLPFFYACTPENDEPISTLEPEDKLDAEDYRIYSLILNKVYPERTKFLVRQRTTTGIGRMYEVEFERKAEILDPGLFDRFQELNAKEYNLGDHFDLRNDVTSYKMVSEKDLEPVTVNGVIDWESYYKMFNTGLHRFTRVAYNADKTQALVEVSFEQSSIGPDNMLLFFIKSGNDWLLNNFLSVRLKSMGQN